VAVFLSRYSNDLKDLGINQAGRPGWRKYGYKPKCWICPENITGVIDLSSVPGLHSFTGFQFTDHLQHMLVDSAVTVQNLLIPLSSLAFLVPAGRVQRPRRLRHISEAGRFPTGCSARRGLHALGLSSTVADGASYFN
jgi:hypothetical protein